MPIANQKSKIKNSLPSDADVVEAEAAHRFGLVDVAQVCDLRRAHQLLDAAHVERAKLVPLGHEDERVSARDSRVLVSRVLDFGERLPRLLRRHGVVCANARALLKERADYVNRRSLAHVVGLRLE